jgi:hypothetical protein
LKLVKMKRDGVIVVKILQISKLKDWSTWTQSTNINLEEALWMQFKW